eukprot:43582-Eustigmatos_ZCMA.PRE.1
MFRPAPSFPRSLSTLLDRRVSCCTAPASARFSGTATTEAAGDGSEWPTRPQGVPRCRRKHSEHRRERRGRA